MTDVNLGDVVEVLDPRPSPTVRQLRSPENFVVLSSVQKRGVFVSFRCPSSCIHGFFDDLSATGCVRSFSLLTGKLWYANKNFQRCESCSDSVHRTLIGSKPHAALTHVQSLWYVLQARRRVNSRRGLSQFDQLRVAHLVNSAT